MSEWIWLKNIPLTVVLVLLLLRLLSGNWACALPFLLLIFALSVFTAAVVVSSLIWSLRVCEEKLKRALLKCTREQTAAYSFYHLLFEVQLSHSDVQGNGCEVALCSRLLLGSVSPNSSSGHDTCAGCPLWSGPGVCSSRFLFWPGNNCGAIAIKRNICNCFEGRNYFFEKA